MTKQELINKAIEQIKEDISLEDVSALDELLKSCPEDSLTNYLPEEVLRKNDF